MIAWENLLLIFYIQWKDSRVLGKELILSHVKISPSDNYFLIKLLLHSKIWSKGSFVSQPAAHFYL